MLQSFLERRLTLSNTAALTLLGGSRPRGPGVQVGFVAIFLVVVTGTVTLLLFEMTGDMLGGGAETVTPAQDVEAEVGGTRATSFSALNILLKGMVGRPVALSSRTVGGPSMIVIRPLSSSFIKSSRKGA